MEDRKRVLVVDDDPAWLSAIETLIADQYDLTLISQPEEALGMLPDGGFSLVVIDMKLPGTNGLEVLRKMHNLVPGIRCIILTGYPDIQQGVDSMKQGALDYVMKGDRDFGSTLRGKIEEALARDLSAGRALGRGSLAPAADRIRSLIGQGESSELELKASARWDIRRRIPNKEIERMVVKTVVAFMNSNGGTLLIGVDDRGIVLGLESDYATLGRKDRDGYENFLTSLLLDHCGKEMSPLFRIFFHEIEGKEICEVIVTPSPKAVFVKDEKGGTMYIRAGNSSRPLTSKEAVEYSRMRWKS